ncbi:MAG: hypothetical protein COA58_04620 [Bacteroidetes bacterium]|nr:MAG: hypothetical protein COA58_04620 [Bacteroidota bacterium]
MWKYVLPFLFFSSSVFAQSDKFLILKHRDKIKEIVINEGEFVVVKTFKGGKVRGRVLVLSENMIKVKHKVVPLTSIERIGRRNAAVTKIASLVVSTGMNLFLYGVSDNLRNGWDETNGNYKAGVPLLGIGIPLLTTTYKRTSKKWKFVGQVSGW